MLPFLQPKKMAGIIMAKHKPDGSTETVGEEGEHAHGLLAAAESLIRAVHAKDANGVASALKDSMNYPEDGDPDPSEEMA